MIEYLRIKNFKSLKDCTFPLAELNIFSGLNGMGKSSLIQTLLLLRQSNDKNMLQKGIILNGDYISLGVGSDILCIDGSDDRIYFGLKLKNQPINSLIFDYVPDSDVLRLSKDSSVNIDDINQVSLFNQRFQYLSAERIAPKANHLISDYHINELNSIGIHGEYAVHYIATHKSTKLADSKMMHPSLKDKAEGLYFLNNLEAWMSEITPGLKIDTEIIRSLNTASLGFSFIQKNERTASFKPQNVGFGLSYVLPVVACILKANAGDLLLIENPESHLHPAGQAIIGRLCALAANNGIQLMIESHSDHFLNGVRVAVKEKIIPSEKTRLFFLERSLTNQHISNVISPEIDEDGRLDVWPKDFFDEWDKQLDYLL